MNQRGELSLLMQMVIVAVIIAVVGVIIYQYVVVGGTGPIPGENLLP